MEEGEMDRLIDDQRDAGLALYNMPLFRQTRTRSCKMDVCGFAVVVLVVVVVVFVVVNGKDRKPLYEEEFSGTFPHSENTNTRGPLVRMLFDVALAQGNQLFRPNLDIGISRYRQ